MFNQKHEEQHPISLVENSDNEDRTHLIENDSAMTDLRAANSNSHSKPLSQSTSSNFQNVWREDISLNAFFLSRHSETDRTHIRILVQAIRNSGALTPITLWRDPQNPNAELVLIDGVHRLSAYQSAGWNKPIPSEVIECSKRDVLLVAAAANSKDTLTLTYSEKADMAWRLVREPIENYTKKEIATATGVSPRTVATMRARLIEIQTEKIAISGSWRRDQRQGLDSLNGGNLLTEVERRAEVKDLAKKVINILGKRLRSDEQLIADVLQETFGYRLRHMADYLYGDVDEWSNIPTFREQYDCDDEGHEDDEDAANADF